MILNFSIENFASFRERQTLTFEATGDKHLEDYYVYRVGKYRILKMALIYGANASGKTNLLAALQFLRHMVLKPKVSKDESLEYEPFLFDTDFASRPSVLRIEFIQENIKYEYEVKFNRTAVLYEGLWYAISKRAKVFERHTDLKNETVSIDFGSKIRIRKNEKEFLENSTLWNDTVMGGFMKSSVAAWISGTNINPLLSVKNWFEDVLMNVVIDESNLFYYVTDALKKGKIERKEFIELFKHADFHISDIAIEEKEVSLSDKEKELLKLLNELNPESKLNQIDTNEIKKINVKTIYNIKDKKFTLPFELESDGTQRFYGLIGLLSLVMHGSKVLPVDELEASLHPDLFNFVVLTFLKNARNSQLIATTHQREILAKRYIMRDDAFWIADKGNEWAATELYSFADFGTKVIRKDTNRLNVYKSGKLGGIPDVWSFTLE